jgi:hypothetical protein
MKPKINWFKVITKATKARDEFEDMSFQRMAYIFAIKDEVERQLEEQCKQEKS